MNPRALIFRLIAWYTGLMLLLCAVFGVYTYLGLERHLKQNTRDLFSRRAQQIGDGLLADIDQRGEAYVAEKITVRFAPESSNRFMRISDLKGNVVYRSGQPEDASFNPQDVPPPNRGLANSTLQELPLPAGKTLLMFATSYDLDNGGAYLIEIGIAKESIATALRGLLFTIGLGLPVMAALAIGGGYILVRRALNPVSTIIEAAENISQSNASRRLPVPNTGDEIQELSLSLNRTLNRLDEALQQAQRFSADASHELRTPLSIMRGELEALIEGASLNAASKLKVGNILEEAERLTKITDGLLTIARFEVAESMPREAFDLSAAVALAAEQIMPLADEKKITLQYHCPNQSVHIHGDQLRIKQAVVNLLDNAIKYTPEKGHIALTIKAMNEVVLIEVKDNGIGIPAQDLPHIFERFYRVDKARSRLVGGTGLGLAIARAICQAHHATIQVESAEGQGTLFRITIPRSQP